MARSQDAQTVSGGQINPYVQQSLQQGRQQSENRLLSAMQESGAIQRQKLAGNQQMEQTKLQANTQMQMQAAEIAAQDRRAAEAEKARREQMTFDETVEKANLAYRNATLEINKRQMELTEAGFEDDRRLREEAEAWRHVEAVGAMKRAELQTNAMLSMVKGSNQAMSGMEKVQTQAIAAKKRYLERVDEYDRLKTNTARRIEMDKRMDLPVVGRKVYKGGDVVPEMGGGGGTVETVPGTEADPLGVIQDELDRNGAGFSISDAAPENIHNLEQMIVENKITAPGITHGLATIDAAIPVLQKKMEDAKLPQEKSFWREKYKTVSDMKDAIEKLKYSKKQIKVASAKEGVAGGPANMTERVGSRILAGLAPIDPLYSPSFEAQMARGHEKFNGDMNAMLEDMTKAVEPTKFMLLPIEPGDSPALIKAKKMWNAPFIETYPELGGTQ